MTILILNSKYIISLLIAVILLRMVCAHLFFVDFVAKRPNRSV